MGRMGIDKNGNRVPIEDLMNPADRKKYFEKLEKRKEKAKIVQSRLNRLAKVEKEKLAELKVSGGPAVECDEVVPDGCLPCTKKSVECGLRVDNYCVRAVGTPCDYDTEKQDTESGVFRAPPAVSNEAPREIDVPEPEVYVEKSPKELEKVRTNFLNRFDHLKYNELKAKCKKLGVEYAHNEKKNNLIHKLIKHFDEVGEDDLRESKL